jgi:hypothetical protein
MERQLVIYYRLILRRNLNMKPALFILLSVFPFVNLPAQHDLGRINATVSSRVDTSSSDVRAIVALYENYLNSTPETIYDNPYWNKNEKALYVDFDFSRESLFQGRMTAEKLCAIFTPFIMSVEPLGEKYQIRVLFSSPTSDPEYAGSQVWCIHKLNALKEDNKWVLENLIVDLTEKWQSQTSGPIRYCFPPNFEFDIEKAGKSRQFCADIIRRFNPAYNSTFSYYVTSSVDDMGLLENFDYYFVGVTTGKTRENRILTATADEFYPHEFVHKLLPENAKRGHLIEEGLAVFLGTKMDEAEYAETLSRLARDLKTNSDRINFQSVVAQQVPFNGYQTAYPAGAAICELIFDNAGDDGLVQLIHSNTSDYDNIISSVMQICGFTKDELVLAWTEIIMRYDH